MLTRAPAAPSADQGGRQYSLSVDASGVACLWDDACGTCLERQSPQQLAQGGLLCRALLNTVCCTLMPWAQQWGRGAIRLPRLWERRAEPLARDAMRGLN